MNIGRVINPATGEVLPLIAVTGSGIWTPGEARQIARSLLRMADQCEGRTSSGCVDLTARTGGDPPASLRERRERGLPCAVTKGGCR